MLSKKISFKWIIIKICRWIYRNYQCRGLKSCGIGVVVRPKIKWLNKNYISLGDNCYLGPNCRIEAIDEYNNSIYSPEIVLGNEVMINGACHIGAIQRVVIKDKSLLGNHVMVIDHSHGNGSVEEIAIAPWARDLYSKGEVVIGERVWVGENAVILPGVHIGDGCIIGASAVVTKDFPANCVIAGNPAKIIRMIL